MSQMTDDKHVDRYVRLTNRERFLIVRGLSLLKDACYIEDGCVMPHMKELIALCNVFCEENWLIGRNINTNKVKRIETPEAYREDQDAD